MLLRLQTFASFRAFQDVPDLACSLVLQRHKVHLRQAPEHRHHVQGRDVLGCDGLTSERHKLHEGFSGLVHELDRFQSALSRPAPLAAVVVWFEPLRTPSPSRGLAASLTTSTQHGPRRAWSRPKTRTHPPDTHHILETAGSLSRRVRHFAHFARATSSAFYSAVLAY